MKYQIAIVAILVAFTLAQDGGFKEIYSAFFDVDIVDLDGWIIQYNKGGATFSKCGKNALVGGYNAFGRKALALKSLKVPPHHKLKVNVQLWRLDSWDNEFMQIYVDGFQWQTRWTGADGSKMCSANGQWTQNFYDVEFVVPHNSPNVNIIFTSTLDEEADNESWGFRNFKLSYIPCPNECGVCHADDKTQCFFWGQVAFAWNKPTVSIEGWSLTGPGNAVQSTCSGINILGGYNNIGTGSIIGQDFKNLPPHFKLLVKMQFWKIDSWDNEEFQVWVDSEKSFVQAFGYNEGVQLCGADVSNQQGNAWAEKVVNVDFQVAHNQPSATLKLTSTLNEGMDNESWGVRDFILFVAQCHGSCFSCSGPGPSDCLTCDQFKVLSNGQCKEGGNWYVSTKEFRTEEQFAMTNNWVFENVYGASGLSVFTKCGTTNLVGGYLRFGAKASATKTFILPPHKTLRLQVQVWKIDSWDNEEFFITADDNKVYTILFGGNDPGQAKLCGNPAQPAWKGRVVNVDSIFAHTAAQVVVKLTSKLDEDASNESWGFREFSILYEPQEECVQFFSECNYGGQMMEICNDRPAFTGVRQAIRSVKVPNGVTVEGFENEQYDGKRVIYRESVDCIKDFDFSFIQTKYETQWVQLQENVMSNNIRRKRRTD